MEDYRQTNMGGVMESRRRYGWSSGFAVGAAAVCCALVAPIFAGCGSEGPERVVVTGTVTYRGQPLEKGQIRFVPAQGTHAPMSGAEIVHGRYAVEARGGVPLGAHKVKIVAHRPDPAYRELAQSLPPDATELEQPPQEQYLPEKYNTNTDLEITIPPGSGKITRDFELAD